MRNSNILKWGNNNKNNKLSLGLGSKNNTPDKSKIFFLFCITLFQFAYLSSQLTWYEKFSFLVHNTAINENKVNFMELGTYYKINTYVHKVFNNQRCLKMSMKLNFHLKLTLHLATSFCRTNLTSILKFLKNKISFGRSINLQHVHNTVFP